MSTLAGIMFVMDGNKYDYNFRENFMSMQSFCDEVVICVIPTEDGTYEDLLALKSVFTNTKIIVVDKELWNATSGKERLSYFSNIAIANVSTTHIISIQADEIITTESIPYIRQAINDNADGFMIRRINLWGNPFTELIAPNQPCSTEVIRLAKKEARCVGDAESLSVPNVNFDYVDKITILHLGFVRKREVMKSKIINMQTGVFQMSDYDKRLDRSEIFDPYDGYFNSEDLIPLKKPLPKYIRQWVKDRYPELFL
jgi:hypothetical protein